MTTAFALSSLWKWENLGVYLACHFTKSVNITFSATFLIFFAPGSGAVLALLAAGSTQLGRRNSLSRKHAIVSRSSDKTSDVSFLLLNCSRIFFSDFELGLCIGKSLVIRCVSRYLAHDMICIAIYQTMTPKKTLPEFEFIVIKW